MARSRYKIFNNQYPYYLTSTTVEWLPLFIDPDVVQIILDSLRFLQKEKRLLIYSYVIMENHLHLIASSQDLSKEIGDFKSFTARRIVDLYKKHNTQLLKKLAIFKAPFKDDRDYQLWQEGFHPEEIQSEEMMRQKIEYIHYNPVRRGYIDEPEHWRYSSARDYAEKKGLIDVCTEW
jgi:putative transposase